MRNHKDKTLMHATSRRLLLLGGHAAVLAGCGGSRSTTVTPVTAAPTRDLMTQMASDSDLNRFVEATRSRPVWPSVARVITATIIIVIAPASCRCSQPADQPKPPSSTTDLSASARATSRQVRCRTQRSGSDNGCWPCQRDSRSSTNAAAAPAATPAATPPGARKSVMTTAASASSAARSTPGSGASATGRPARRSALRVKAGTIRLPISPTSNSAMLAISVWPVCHPGALHHPAASPAIISCPDQKPSTSAGGPNSRALLARRSAVSTSSIVAGSGTSASNGNSAASAGTGEPGSSASLAARKEAAISMSGGPE